MRDLDAGSAAPPADLLDAGESSLQVRVHAGMLEGVRVGDIRAFRGIPYAAPPVGALRFAPPMEFKAWSGMRMAQSFGPSCMQFDEGIEGPKSEDCLTLNVFAPLAASASSLPVMVFFHGGGFGSGGSASFPSEFLSAAAQAVIVTVNYRLGRLGFLRLDELDVELGMASGNMGLRDQQSALAWVRQNIAAFGGMPERVTLFGQSAGAVSSCLHMFATGSERLLEQLILESGACVVGPFVPRTRQEAQDASNAIVQQLCPTATDRLACLRSVPADALVPSASDAETFKDWSAVPHVDGELFTDSPLAQLREGHFQHKPIMLGTNVREAALYETYGLPRVNNRLDMSALILLMHPEAWSELTAHYTPAADADAREAFFRAITDYEFRCPARLLARALASHNVPTFLYSFEVPPAAHSQELDYVFGWPCCGVSSKLTEAPYPTLQGVVDVVQGAWSAFARTGNPNGGQRPLWPQYEVSTDQHMVLSQASAVDQGLASSDCDWWETVFAPNP